MIPVCLVLLSLLIGAAFTLCSGGGNETSPAWGEPTPQTQTDESADPGEQKNERVE